MSPSKTKGKGRREHKSTSKASTSTQPANAADLPPNFGFLYRIDALTTDYTEHRKRILCIGAEKKGNDVGNYWFPPIRRSQFKRRVGHIYRWLGDGTAEKLDVPPGSLQQFHVASVFFQARQDNFLAVFKDCVENEIANEPIGWSQIGFHHLHTNMSCVDIGGEKSRLSAPADQNTWMPQVLPKVYNYEKNPLKPIFKGESGGLCGKLSLLIAMAAFSAPVEDAENIVAQCFGYKEWLAHRCEIGIGRYEERGVVVRIYLDPEAVGIERAHLRAFEDGKYGPIFEPKPPATPQPQAYTHQQPTFPYSSHIPADSTPRSMSYSYSPGDTSQYAQTGYSITPDNAAPSGYPAAIGDTAASGYPAVNMITQSSELYEEADEKVEEDKT